MVSPCCGDGFDEAVRCAVCGDWEAGDMQSYGLCRRCACKAVERLQMVLQGEFSAEERELLNDVFDGVPLTQGVEWREDPGRMI